MISNGRSDANRKVLFKRVSEHLLPPAQAWGLRLPSPAVAAPDSGDSHTELRCHLIPRQALVTELQNLLGGDGISGSTDRTHCDACTLEPFAHRAPMNAELGTDLAKAPTLGVQVGCTFNVHRANVTSSSRRFAAGMII